jgi:D-alanyl-D-alanine carboxypeptidase/D-alanyl-D-alanine-endopeptidase (penicillin-binding protein 4)
MHLTFCAVAFAALAAAAPAQVAAPPQPAVQIQSAVAPLQPLVDRLVREAGFSAKFCVYVEDANGATLANVNGTQPFAPASNNKLVTSAAALTLLGPNHTFVTRVMAGGPVSGGVLQGDLVIYGGGDPTISGRFQKDKMDVTATMREWAARLKRAGVTSITGNVVADDSFFDDQYFHPGWAPGERAEWYSAEVSALSFNDNCVDISWSAKGKNPGDTVSYSLNPKTDYINFNNQVMTVAKGRSTERYYRRAATDNNITATGSLNVDTTKLDSTAVHDPAHYFVTVLTNVLKEQGISVQGRPVKSRGAAANLQGGAVLFDHASPSLLQICNTINQNSQNFYTESVAKALGKLKTGQGSWDAGMRVIEDFCKSANIYSVGHDAVDGSGLAAANRVSGKQLADVMRYMDSNGLKEQWRSTLPQGGVRGSLKSRFSNTPGGTEVRNRIYGKTGLIGGVRTLSGMLTDANGREMYYSIMLNDLPRDAGSKGIAFLDKVAVELAKSGK